MTVRLMAEARFDPNAFRTLLEKINEAQTGAFAFNHPQAHNLPPEIAEEIDDLSTPQRPAHTSVEFRTFRAALQKAAYQPPVKPAAGAVADATPAADPLPNVFTHPMDYYRMGYPAGWRVTPTDPNGAIIAPPDGIQTSRNGDDVSHGVMFDLFDITVPDNRSLTLEQATNRLIVYLSQRNLALDPHTGEIKASLHYVPGAETQTLISDEPGLRIVMIGRSDTSDSSEVAWVVTRLYYQSLFYMVFVAPEDKFSTYQPIFEQMMRSVRMR
jgi:hypothetical protein